MNATGGVAAVILAAGRSERMGRFKPLLPFGEEPAVVRVARTFQTAGADPVVVVTGHHANEVEHLIEPPVHCVENPDYPRGMFTSVQSGVGALPSACRAFFVHPVDIPLVRVRTIERLTEAFRRHWPAILYPAFDGERGHPPLIRGDLAAGILAWHGRGGLRSFLQNHETDSRVLPVADEAILFDMDTDDDYLGLTARREDLPSPAECRVLMDAIQDLPLAVAAHCRVVGAVARHLAEALVQAGIPIDRDLVAAAALLHDIARADKDHAAAGARLLETHGFARIAPLVAAHMDLAVDPGQPVDEAQLVFLADKLVAGDRRVPLEERFARKMAKYGRDPHAAARIVRRRDNARRVRDKVERLTGRSITALAAGWSARGKS